MKKFLNEGNLIHNFISNSGSGTVISSSSGTVISYGSGAVSDFLTSSGSGSTSQKVTVLTVPASGSGSTTLPHLLLFWAEFLLLSGRRLFFFKSVSDASVADPDPGSGAFLAPGFGIQDGYKIKIRIRDEHPGSYFRELRNNFFGLKMVLQFF
jgi:hypothetical protein